jgi:hypothetical protein
LRRDGGGTALPFATDGELQQVDIEFSPMAARWRRADRDCWVGV